MGLSVSWAGIKGLDRGAILAALHAMDTGEVDEAFFAPLSIAEAPKGWFVVCSNRYDYFSPARLAALSADGGLAVGCAIEEHVMCSHARAYENGVEVWAMSHDGGQQGVYDLTITGDPPEAFGPIHKRLMSEQADAGGEDADVDHLFDLPSELAAALFGYRPDGPEANALAFTSLRTVREPVGSLWGFVGALFRPRR